MTLTQGGLKDIGNEGYDARVSYSADANCEGRANNPYTGELGDVWAAGYDRCDEEIKSV